MFGAAFSPIQKVVVTIFVFHGNLPPEGTIQSALFSAGPSIDVRADSSGFGFAAAGAASAFFGEPAPAFGGSLPRFAAGGALPRSGGRRCFFVSFSAFAIAPGPKAASDVASTAAARKKWRWRFTPSDSEPEPPGVARNGAVAPRSAALAIAAPPQRAYAASVKTFLRVIAAAVVANLSVARAQNPVTEEIPIGFLPDAWVQAAIRQTLSAQARAVMASPTGPLRLTDTAERVAAARQKLAQLQAAPALVPFEITFAVRAQRVVQRLPVEPPVVDRGIPIPQRYDPPRIIAGPNNVVVPAQPREFRTRSVGPGGSVSVAPSGYQTITPEVRMSETETTTAQARKFAGSTVLGRAAVVPVLRAVPDLAALRALAEKHAALPADEPAWTAAGTELLVTPEAAGAAVMVKIVPQIVLAPAVAGQPPRRIPIPACSAGIMIARGALTQTGTLPKTDPEFYRVFLGATQAVDDTVTALTLSANVQYLGDPPR